MIEQIFILLISFQVKHFLCDYPLQTQFMLEKSKLHDWVLPLQQHCMVHATGTMIVLFLFADVKYLFLYAFIDFFLHFSMDRIKASPNMLGKFKPDNKYFWWALGGDQSFHHLTHYLIIYMVVS